MSTGRHSRRAPRAMPRAPVVEPPGTARALVLRMVQASVDGLPDAYRSRLGGVDFVVEDVPPEAPPQAVAPEVALSLRRTTGGRDQIVLFRRPIEVRASSAADFEDLVHEIVVHEVGHYLGLDAEDIDRPD